MTLPYDYSRCAGQILPKEVDWIPPKLHRNCNDCRRREPGHPERQIYIVPILELSSGACVNRIIPKTSMEST
jgi:hypothetical protein